MNAVDKATATMIANLHEKSGRTLEQWIAIARKTGLGRHGEIVSALKSRHGLGHGYANLVAQGALHSGAPAGDADLLAAQYAGAKAALRPLYDAIIARVQEFGADVEIAPKKTYVSLRRSKQFALVQPSTGTRLDLGINLKGEKPTPRLEASGSFNAMVTHRVRVERAEQIDKELVSWLKQAYQSA